MQDHGLMPNPDLALQAAVPDSQGLLLKFGH